MNPDETASSLSDQERDDALNPNVGDGTPDSAPTVTPPGGDDVLPTWKPTKKWLAALAGALASIAASWIVTGAFDDVERGMAATALVSLVAAYFKGNDPTPGGVPE